MSLVDSIAQFHDLNEYQEQHWEGSFSDYLQKLKTTPEITRNAYQRCYEMILSYGREEYIDNKKKLVHYKF
ncbi:MAG: serine protein kinase, partial [Myxococcota bacterium]